MNGRRQCTYLVVTQQLPKSPTMQSPSARFPRVLARRTVLWEPSLLHITRTLLDCGELRRPSRRWLPLLTILVAGMPLCFAIPYRLKVLPIAVLFAASIALVLADRRRRASYIRAWLVLLACVAVVLFSVVNVAATGGGWRSLDLPAQNIIFLGIAGAFVLPLRWRRVWLLFSLTTCGLGAINVVQHYWYGVVRPYGPNNGDWGAVEYAMILVVMSLLALVQLLRTGALGWERGIHALACFLGLFGALLSQSRGPLLAFALVFLGVLALHVVRTKHWCSSLLALIAVMGCLVVTTTYVQPEIGQRLLQVHTEVDSYRPVSDARGAIRERLELWRAAWGAFRTHPWNGVGIGRFGDYVKERVAQGRSNPVIAQYEHAHNEYMEAAATGGLPGLLVLLGVFLVPLGYFFRRCRDPDETMSVIATMGLVVVGVYMSCALTDNVFYRAMPHSLYYFLVTGLAVLSSRVPAPTPKLI